MNNALDKRKKTQEREEKAGDDQLPELVLNKGDKSKYVMAAVDYITEHYEILSYACQRSQNMWESARDI